MTFEHDPRASRNCSISACGLKQSLNRPLCALRSLRDSLDPEYCSSKPVAFLIHGEETRRARCTNVAIGIVKDVMETIKSG